MTRTVRLTVPRAAPDDAPYELPFEACSIYVENPSGVWYQAAGFTIPPWTWGQVNRLDVASRTIAIAQTTPAGMVSENYGGDLLVVAHAASLDPSPGRPIEPHPRYQQVEFSTTGNTDLTNMVATFGEPGVSQVLVSASLVAEISPTVAPLAGMVTLFLFDLGIAWFRSISIAPESPAAHHVYVPRSLISGPASTPGEDMIGYTLRYEAGMPEIGLLWTLEFYEVLE